MKILEPLELYIHIPFCVKKCNYCDFLSYAAEEDERSAYVDALLTQIRMVGTGLVPGCDPEDPDFEERENKFKVSTIYIGGGTPTVLTKEQIASVLTQVRESFDILSDAEITVEANPGTVDPDKLKCMRDNGVNRLSLGLQSSCEDELKCLGRIHTYEQFEKCFNDARLAGFDNISVDVMTALPDQNEKKLRSTLMKVIEKNPEHISAYSLIVEEDTPFYEKYGDIEGPVVGEEMERKLYYLTREILEENGYMQYEISNFAKPGYEAVHNCGYWKRKHYFGLGLGASSFFDRYRVAGTESISEYFKNPCAFDNVSKLSDNDIMEEYMYLGLRMTEGISTTDFDREFAASMGTDFATLYGKKADKLIAEGLMKEENDRLSLTKKGIDYGNFVFSQFLL